MSRNCFVCDGPAHRSIGGVLLCPEHAVAVDDVIDSIRADGGAVDISRIAYNMRAPETQAQFAPSAGDVHAFLQRHDITGGQAARMMYLSGSRQVRKYTGGENPRQMDGARWFCLHAHVLLSADKIAQIEAAMAADLTV